MLVRKCDVRHAAGSTWPRQPCREIGQERNDEGRCWSDQGWRQRPLVAGRPLADPGAALFARFRCL